MTNWVTIKIPEDTRDEAREIDATYEEVMKAGLSALNGDEPINYSQEVVEIDGAELAESIDWEPGDIGDVLGTTKADTSELETKIDKAIELAEQAKLNTEEIKGAIR